MKQKKKFLNIFLMFLLALGGCGQGTTGEVSMASVENVDMWGNGTEVANVDDCMVRIESEGVVGSGVIYECNEEELIILTAGHVVGAGDVSKEKAEAIVYFADGSAVECKDILCSDITDLARVKVPREEVAGDMLSSGEAAVWDKESFDKLQEGDMCVIRGYSDKELVSREGNILHPWIFVEDYEQYMIWAQGEISPGMSGGGLFDEAGQLLGILSGGSSDGELVAVPLSLILQFEQSGW